MRTTKFLLLLFSLIFVFHPLSKAQDSYSNEEAQDTKESLVPNPIDLKPEWITYFEVPDNLLEERIDKTKALLDRFETQLETKEEQLKTETQIKRFHSSLESLLLLKKQKIETPSFTWLPKSAYSLDDFLEIADKIRDLNNAIISKKSDQQRYKYSVVDARQALNNAYVSYLNLPENSKERFLQGLEVMVLGARLLYLEAEIEITEKMIALDQQLLDRYEDEREYLDESLTFKIDVQKLRKEKEEVMKDLSKVHNELLGLEVQSVRVAFQQDGQEASRIADQKLTNSLIKEALIKTKLSLIDAKFVLNDAIEKPGEVVYKKDVEPIRIFRNDTRKQLLAWEKLIAVEVDRLSQSLVEVDGDGSEVKKVSAYEEGLKISLSSSALLDSLANELFYLEVVLGLIDQNVIQETDVVSQISYMTQNYLQLFYDSFGGWLHYSLFEIGGVPITLIGLLKAFLIVLVSIWISNIIGRGLKRFAQGKGVMMEPTLYSFRRVIHYLVLLIGVLFALASLGLTMRNMAIVLGAVGIGLGFGLQNIVNNFLCGLVILIERNVKIGDYVELESGFLGKITAVNVQNTTLHTFDGIDVLVPNSSLIVSNVVNWTKKNPYIRLHIPFGVAYGTDQEKVTKVVTEVALKIPYTMKASKGGVNDPEVWLVEFGESSLNFELVVWVNIFKSRGRTAMKAAYLKEIELAFKKHGIHIPFPQRDLHIKTQIVSKTMPSESDQIKK